MHPFDWHTFEAAYNTFIAIPMELLKLLVLIEARMFFERTFDVSELSHLLFIATGRYITVTTLLQVYGFLPTVVPPPRYVQNALAEFCGYESYSSYLKDITVTGA